MYKSFERINAHIYEELLSKKYILWHFQHKISLGLFSIQDLKKKHKHNDWHTHTTKTHTHTETSGV